MTTKPKTRRRQADPIVWGWLSKGQQRHLRMENPGIDMASHIADDPTCADCRRYLAELAAGRLRTFPFDPVEQVLRDRLGPPPKQAGTGDYGATHAAMGRVLGVEPVMIARYINEGMKEQLAERIAMKLGHEPSTLWDDWYAPLDLELVS